MNPLENLQESLADRYKVEREIGVGGMATVYLAKDLRHDRDVALKLLKPELGAVLGPERFLSEIRVTAKLQHPNLLPLFDSGESNGQLWYAMPYVEGESLRAKMERERQLSVREAVRIAVLVAGALDYAHRHGVIHRDLKPENILLHEGQPLVADFGIALAVSNAGGERVTQTGLSLGTPQYMSPEQATGERGVDGRTDIYSLGAVLYEMLTGEPPHTGATVQAIIARLMTDTPRTVRSSRPSVPENVDWAIQKALEKVPADRFDTAKEFAETLEGQRPITSSRIGETDQRSGSAGRRRTDLGHGKLPWILFGLSAVVLAASIAALGMSRRGSDVSAEPTRFTISPVQGEQINIATIAVSPDGREIVYSGTDENGAKLFRRRLDEVSAHAIDGTDDGRNPAFSPDGRFLAFFSGNDIKKIPAGGGSPLTIASGVSPTYIAWTASGDIVIPTRALTQSRSGFSHLPAAGGTPSPLLKSDSAHGQNFNMPIEAPGGTLLFRAEGPGGGEDDFLAVAKVGGDKFISSKLTIGKVLAYIDGYAIVSKAGTPPSIQAVPFDLKSGMTGEPIALVDGLVSAMSVSLSPAGTLVYANGDAASKLLMLDLSGKADTVIGQQADYLTPAISPDGKTVSFSLPSTISSELWVYNIAGKTSTRLAPVAMGGRWMPDGKSIVFQRPTTAAVGLWKIPTDGSGGEVHLEPKMPPGASAPVGPFSISSDGSTIVFVSASSGSRFNIYWFKPGVDDVAHAWLATPADEYEPMISPNGKWVAYLSDEAGRDVQLFVRPFPSAGARVQISVSGANAPMWSPDGRVLYYRSGAQLIAADLSEAASALTVKARRSLMSVPAAIAMAPDGRHFIAAKPATEETKVVVVENWLTEVRRKIREAGK
jgi:eukaryotic-like serine/threonine-protein kinase